MTDRKQGIHPICRFVDLVVLVAAGMVLSHPHDEVEDGDEGANGVRVASKHKVTKADVIICGYMTGRYPRKGRLKHPIKY